MSKSIPLGWELVPLSEFCIGIRGVAYSPSDLHKNRNERTITLLRSNNIQSGGLVFDDVQYVDSSKVKLNQIAKKNDIAVCMSNGSKRLVGKSAVFSFDSTEKFTVGAFCSIYRPLNGVEADFVKQLFNSDQFQQQVDFSLAGSAINNLKNSDIEEYIFSKPPIEEQQKIAAILTAVDEVIESTQAQINKLKDLKTGMMQELLTKGIGRDGQPHTEFKDSPLGWIPKGWSVKKLDDVSVNLDSKRVPIKSTDRAEVKGQYPYYGASGIIDYVSDYIFDGEYLLLGEDGENVLSRNLPLAFIVKGKFWVNNHAHVLQAKPGINLKFLCEYLESLDYKNIASGSAQPKITKGALSEIYVPVPSTDEQDKIADTLTAIDEKLGQKKLKLDHFQKMKKGLMQDLLSGKVRINANR